MKKFIYKTIVSLLAKRGIIFQQVIQKEKLREFIQQLHPVQTQFDLIRLGPNQDGGYLVPDCLDDIVACFSPGVAKVSEFEYDCLKRGMKIFMADKSVEKPNWDVPEDKYDFQKKFVGCTNNEDFMTMDSWFESTNLPEDAELLLQMDIEFGEYPAIMNMSDEMMSRFKVIVIEFHRLQHLWNPAFFRAAETVFKKILQTHVPVHLHPNNFKGPKDSVYSIFGIDIPKLIEFSFIRKDVAEIKGYRTQFPHPLDFDNLNKGHLTLPRNWYRSNQNSIRF